MRSSVAVTVGWYRGLVENVLGVIAELRFAIALRIRERFWASSKRPETAQILAKQVIGAADVTRNFLGVAHETDVIFEGFDGLGETLSFRCTFRRDRDRRMIPRTQALGVQECGFGSGKITQGDIGNAKKQECVVNRRTEFQFAFELQAGLRIGFFATELEDGVAQQARERADILDRAEWLLRNSATAGSENGRWNRHGR